MAHRRAAGGRGASTSVPVLDTDAALVLCKRTIADLKSALAEQKHKPAKVLAGLASREETAALLLKQGGVKLLVALTDKGFENAKEVGATALANLAEHKRTRDALGSAGAIGPLVRLLRTGSNKGANAACSALACSAYQTSRIC